MIIGGRYVENPEVLIARELERGGWFAPGLDFIRWRFDQLLEEIRAGDPRWSIYHRCVASMMAQDLAETRVAAARDRKGLKGLEPQVRDIAGRLTGTAWAAGRLGPT